MNDTTSQDQCTVLELCPLKRSWRLAFKLFSKEDLEMGDVKFFIINFEKHFNNFETLNILDPKSQLSF